MKQLWIALTLILAAAEAQALAADRFACTFEIKDLASEATVKQEHDFFIARIPMPKDPHSDIQITSGRTNANLTLLTKDYTIKANLNFFYKHAMRTINGVAEARQFQCIGIAGGYCETRGNQPCFDKHVSCLETHEPFDPEHGWMSTSVFGGVPAYNERNLATVSQEIVRDSGEKVGLINFTCKYQGTYQ